MARLNKTQIYAINWLNHIGKDQDTIASELKITTKQVISTIEKNQSSKNTKKSDPIKTASKSAAKKIVSKNLMINQTSAKKSNHVMIMTQEASMMNDTVKKNVDPQTNRNQKHIFRPNQDGK
jgi:hypothetical protein